jgi:broad specificity phosphatase PhoE
MAAQCCDTVALMAKFVLIRHGATDEMSKRLCGRMPGVALSAEGRAQARRLHAALVDVEFQAVLASPQQRAVETARAFSDAAGVEPRFDEIDFGDWTGVTFEELSIRESWIHYNQCCSHQRPPRGESLVEVLGRSRSALEELAKGNDDAVFAIVTHLDVIRVIIAWALGMPFDLFTRISAEPGSVSEVIVSGGFPEVVRVNSRM